MVDSSGSAKKVWSMATPMMAMAMARNQALSLAVLPMLTQSDRAPMVQKLVLWLINPSKKAQAKASNNT